MAQSPALVSGIALAAVLSLISEHAPSQSGSGRVSLEASLRSLIAASGAEVAVAFRTLDGRSELLIDPDKDVSRRQHHEGAGDDRAVPAGRRRALLSLDDPLPIRNEFHSIVDGSVYQLSVGDDSDAEVYEASARR